MFRLRLMYEMNPVDALRNSQPEIICIQYGLRRTRDNDTDIMGLGGGGVRGAKGRQKRLEVEVGEGGCVR